jgi:hypothetical protein
MHRHFLAYSAPGGKSLQQWVRGLIQNFGSCDVMSGNLDMFSCLIVSQ